MFSGTDITELPTLPKPIVKGGIEQILPTGAFMEMFKDCTKITQIPSGLLPYQYLNASCYSSMFENCENLENVDSKLLEKGKIVYTDPTNPDRTIKADACYQNMFRGCESLKSAPELPWINQLSTNCYYGMFAQCRDLQYVPQLLSPYLAKSCYAMMFEHCVNLTGVSSGQWILPAEDLSNADECYQSMFFGCIKLQAGPWIKAIYFGSEESRFAKGCLSNMFENCSSLNSLKVNFTTWDGGSGAYQTGQWLHNTSQTGSLICPRLLIDNTPIRGSTTIPAEWEAGPE